MLTFWSANAPQSLALLKQLQQAARGGSTGGMEVLAINVDDPSAAGPARSFASQQRFAFPVLFATSQAAGVYNLIYRHLFDRHRDMPIPLSLLIDEEGMIVRVYQGVFEGSALQKDVLAIPRTPKDRLTRALPFPGMLVQSTFQRNDFTYGVAMHQHGYLEQAAQSFQQVIAAKPDNADAYYNLGTLRLRSNNLAEARSYLEHTIKLEPNYPEAWNNLGMIAAQQGQMEEAIDDFEKSLALRPKYATAHLNLGNVYRRQKLFAKAEESLKRALQIQPDDPDANYSIGMLYAQQNQAVPASEYLQRAIELRPDFAEALNNLGIVLVRQQDFSRAEEEFKSGIKVAPNFDQSYLNLARLYAMRSDKEKARAVLQDLLHVQPDNPGAKQALELLQ